ncbi:hypothetical protein ACRB68_37070 [Actinomadura sp. RB68]|uniref:DUF2029 domain-containing protein n=2 Tax=Actinomadura macrotermitis TaxID=2585200 RepID=A0A7K0BWS5_9ACTN|nr:hypothetical protein [Actinomadura macrotermitis]
MSRAATLLFAASALRLLHHLSSDMRVYAPWSKVIAGGAFPTGQRWQYPPLAAPVIAAPRLLGFLPYPVAFLLLALLADALVLALLLRSGRRRAGAWFWVAGLFALGGIAYFRYDLFVTAVAVAALLALPRQRVFGALAGAGAMLKIWPALLLLAVPRDRRALRAVAGFAAAVLAVVAGAALFAPGQAGFLEQQGGRGMEIEAVAVTPWQLARLFGHLTPLVHRYGCVQFAGRHMDAVALACQAATAGGLALVALLAWRRGPWTPAAACDTALAAVLVAVVTSRVLSPQYLVWLIGLGAAALAFPGRRRAPLAVLLLAAALLTQLVFPIGWDGLRRHDPDPLPVLVLTARNLLLLAATALAVLRLRPSAAGSTPR